MVKKLHLFILLLCTATTFAQQKLHRADKLFEGYAYTEAAKLYEEYLADAKNPDGQVLIKVAESNYKIGKMGAAIVWYRKAISLQGDSIREEYLLHYRKALRVEQLYDEADKLDWTWLENMGTDVLRKRFTTQKQHLDSLNKNLPAYKVENLAINTNKADFGTAFYGDKIVYASGKDINKAHGRLYSWNEQPFLTLYVSDRDTTNGAFVNEQKFMPKAQTSYHNAAPAFSPDLKTAYYSANNVTKSDRLENDAKGTNNIELIKRQLQEGQFIKQERVQFNSKSYSVGQPAVSADGKWLYFVSDMPGGLGETDIYVAEIFSDGKLGTPKNLGSTINTTGREMFPFINDDILYFSSDGHYGLGGLDVFTSKRTLNNQFETPKNIGKPINSNRDDFAYIVSKDGSYGYLSSNRDGGKGDDDIYYVTRANEEPCGQLITGKVVNKKTGQPIEGVAVKAQVNGLGYTDTSKTDGTYSITIPCGTEAVVEGEKPDYTKGKPNEKGDIELSKYDDLIVREGHVEKVAINPIYFDFDKYYIRPQAAAELDKVVYVMQNFPKIVIKIESHTDSRGNDEYNMQLSDDRAKSTYSYIIAKGIQPERIESVKGYGESRHINKCSNGVECSEEDHQLNRRSDFIIVKK
jgi:outer membrane protein OmpA-like peptidoglycan-associated protein